MADNQLWHALDVFGDGAGEGGAYVIDRDVALRGTSAANFAAEVQDVLEAVARRAAQA